MSDCEPIEGNGYPCDADCNDITTIQYYYPYVNNAQSRALRQGDGAYLPAATVCRQQLWRPCEITYPFHPYNNGLYQRQCSQAAAKKRF